MAFTDSIDLVAALPQGATAGTIFQQTRNEISRELA